MISIRKVVIGKMLSRMVKSFGGFRNYSDVHDQTDPPSLTTSSTNTPNFPPVTAERLKTRSVLAVSGPDSIGFLNKLTTNELNQLKTDVTSVHAFFLNAKGRIIHDALIYKPDEDDTLFVECDIASLQALQTHLIMYRSKTNVEIRDVEQDVGVWAVYDPVKIEESTTTAVERETSFFDELDLGEDVLLSPDPRMSSLGVRVLAPKDVDVGAALKTAGVRVHDAPNVTYKTIRYKLGVAEGNAEIGYGRSLPAEINGDHTNAVSLVKTNYVGWSPDGLKRPVDYRMLPLKFLGNTSTLPINSEITDRKGKKRSPIGFLRGVQNSYGIGLMHVPSVMSDQACLVRKIPAECIRPPWWNNAQVPELKKMSQ